jgi:hypothetical protein
MDKLISGAHAIIYSKDAKADRVFRQDMLGLVKVNTGRGWLIFGLLSAELAVHPTQKNNVHEFFSWSRLSYFFSSIGDKKAPCDPVGAHLG